MLGWCVLVCVALPLYDLSMFSCLLVIMFRVQTLLVCVVVFVCVCFMVLLFVSLCCLFVLACFVVCCVVVCCFVLIRFKLGVVHACLLFCLSVQLCLVWFVLFVWLC